MNILCKHGKLRQVLQAAYVGALTLLGFTGCEDDPGVAMYGTPHADYSIKGAVETPEGTAIPGIKVSLLQERIYDLEQSRKDTLQTTVSDEQGAFNLETRAFPTQKLIIAAEDVDGEANGSYQETNLNIAISKEDFQGGDQSWYSGKVEKEVTVQMKEKSHE